MADHRSFWEELKQRRVVRVGLVYLPVAWALVLSSNEITDILALPAWTPRLVLGLAVLGFPLALGLAWALQVTEKGVVRAPALPGGGSSRLAFIGGLTVGLVSLGAAAYVLRGPSADAAPPSDGALNYDRVVVYPLRAQVPPELSWLGEGLADALAYNFDGEGGPTAVAFGTVVSASAGGTVDAEAVARAQGAGMVASGSVVGSAAHIVVQVDLRQVDGSEPPKQARAEGHPDSITAITDQLAAQLLGLAAGEYRESLSYLSADVGAVKSYLAGRQSWRHGDYWDAVAEFDAAISADSTFALAAIGRADAANMAFGAGSSAALALADRHRDRLPAADRLYLDVRRGTGEPNSKTYAERLAEWEALTQALPDRVEAWYFQAETYMHRRFWGHTDWAERSIAMFQRALDLDPNHIPSKEHIFFVRTMVGPPDQLQAAAAAMQEARGRGLVYEGLVAGTGFITLDPEVLTEVDEDYLRLSSLEAGFMPDLVPPDFLPYADAAVAELHARAASSDERQAALEADFQLASLLGQPTRVRRVTERLVNEFGMLPSRSHIRRALWGVGNADLAKRAVDSLTTSLNQRPSSAYSWGDLGDASAVESDRFARDQAYTGGALTGSFRAEMDRFPRGRSLMLEAYALLFESWAAVRQSQEGVDPMVDRIDDIVRQGPQSFPGVDYLIPLALVLEEHGQYTKAIDFLGRGGVFGFGAERYAAEILEFRGRLAEASGDIDLAITEYRRYVKIRAFAGPELQPELERVRAKLASLQGR